MVLGVADGRGPDGLRPVVGSAAVEDARGKAEALYEKLRFRVDVQAVDHPDGRVVVLTAPPRPAGTAYKVDGVYWMRSGERLVEMSEDRLRSIFAEGRPEWLERPAELADGRTEVSEAEAVGLLDTARYFELLGREYPSSQSRVAERLAADRLIDAGPGGVAVRNIAALLLARDLSSFRNLDLIGLRVNVYEGTDKLDKKLDRVFARGYAVGYHDACEFVVDQLPQSQPIRGMLRKRDLLVPEICVRELVANMLTHADYGVRGARPTVWIYSDRVEFTNPGRPLVDIDRFVDASLARNPRVAELMRRMRICEVEGSGIDKVIRAAERDILWPPEFGVGVDETRVFVRGAQPFEEMIPGDRVRACYQHCCLCREQKTPMTNSSLRDRFGLPDNQIATVSRVIAATVEEGLIRPDPNAGGRKFARYLPHWA